MKPGIHPYLFLLPLLCLAAARAAAPDGSEANPASDLVSAVDPTIGTSGQGSCTPAVTVPFGMIKPGPDTGANTVGYSEGARTFEGFSLTHMSGIGGDGDQGNILIQPTIGPLRTGPGEQDSWKPVPVPDDTYRQLIDKSSEKVSAAYYAVRYPTDNIGTEITCTNRAAIFRFDFPSSSTDKPARVQLDLSHKIGGSSARERVEVLDDHTVRGWAHCDGECGVWGGGKQANYTVYFYAQFDRPFTAHGFWQLARPASDPKYGTKQFLNDPLVIQALATAPVQKGGTECEGDLIGFYGEFGALAAPLQMKIAISYVDMDGAKKNLESELPGFDFDKVHQDAIKQWATRLNAIQLEGATEDQKKIFYTALYHTYYDPRLFCDVDGRYYGADYKVHIPAEGAAPRRSVFSGWDVYRSEFPLMTLLDPDMVNDMVNNFIEMSQESPRGMPEWEQCAVYNNCMNGDPAVTVIVDAYMKGIRGYDAEKAFAACKQNALGPNTSRGAFAQYNRLGFIPRDVSATLLYCYADWSIAQFAKALGKKEDQALFEAKALNYKLLYSPEDHALRRKDADGKTIPPDPQEKGNYGFIECSPVQGQWDVPHDIGGLIALMGPDNFRTQLDALFNGMPDRRLNDCGVTDYYDPGNEPDILVPYLFNYDGRPWLTQKWIRLLLKREYTSTKKGIPGNDDVGEMSAWYILNCMGFHPECPGDNVWNLTSPLFAKAILTLPNGKTFTVVADGNSETNIYIQSATLNGQPLDRPWLKHEELIAGGELKFVMGPEPSHWGATHPPPSFSIPVPQTP